METDLRDALIAWQGGDLPPDRTDELLAKLRANAELRSAFATEVWTLSLTRIAQAPEPRWLALQEELGLSTPQRDLATSSGFEAAVMSTVRRQPAPFVAAWWRKAAYGAMAASALLALGIAAWTLRQPPTSSAPNPRSPMVAVLVHSDHAVWQALSKPPTPSSTFTAGPLHLASGRASLLFTSGVMLDIEGPAHLELLTVDRVICHEGRLRARVPKGAEGFCVETPNGAVTDLGTEFGVSLAPNGKTHVAVFEGKAEVSSPISGQEGIRTALLSQHESAELLPGTGEIRPQSDATFLAPSSWQLPSLSLTPEYPAMVRASKPVHYWRLDRTQNGTVPNEVTDAPALHIAGGAAITPDASGQSSALLSGKDKPGALYLDEPWSKPASGHAIELWFAADTVGQMSLVALTAVETQRRHISLVEVGGRRPGTNAQTGIIRYLSRWPAAQFGGMNLYSPPIAFPFQWHHLVAQQKGGTLQVFMDGEPVGTTSTGTPPDAAQCSVQFGCLEFHPGNNLAKLERLFSGRLAEIALYDRLLTPQEIQQHAASARRAFEIR